MAKITGVVDKIYVKKGSGKGGKPWKRYAICIDGEWYNHGFKAPDCTEGDEVSITFEKGDYGNDISDMTLVADTTEDRGAKKPAGKTSDNTQQIHRQNALRHATHLAVAQGNFSLENIVEVANDLCVYIETGRLPEAKKEPTAPVKKASKTLSKEKHGFEDVEDDVEDIT